MTIKNSKPETVPSKPAAAPEKPKKEKAPFDAKGHLEALQRLDDLLNSTMSDGGKTVIRQFRRTVAARLKPYAKTTFVVE